MSAPKSDARWCDGPWSREADAAEWQSHGFGCEMKRHSSMGHWCGYVIVPAGHPWHGNGTLYNVDVHGGVTYASHAPGGGWKVGFDCAHLGDVSPLDVSRSGMWTGEYGAFVSLGGRYRDEVFVRGEVERLAVQAAEAAR